MQIDKATCQSSKAQCCWNRKSPSNHISRSSLDPPARLSGPLPLINNGPLAAIPLDLMKIAFQTASATQFAL
jgi:hypothetical protein